jgi:hypothetical protein
VAAARRTLVFRTASALAALLVPIGALGQSPPDAQSEALSDGPPPAGGYQPYDQAVAQDGQKVIVGVPAYRWRHGCGPTAAGMVIGYWDGHGFPRLIPGDAATQTAEVNQAMTSTAHYDDYSLPIDNNGTGILPDKSTTGGAHSPHNCLGDFMNTSWSSKNNYYGWSWFSAVDDSLLGYTNTFVKSQYDATYRATARNEAWGTFTWTKYCAEIGADRPLVFLVDSDGNGGTDHFVTAIGYRDTSGYPEYACLDTWGTAVRWQQFRQMSNTYSWGIYGATYYSLADARRLGDTNCDGAVNFADINPFVVALGDINQYKQQYPNCYWQNADCDDNGAVTFADIDPFVQLLGGE